MLDTDAIYRARDEAQKSGDYARAVVETVHEALVVVDSEWRMLTANRSFCDLFRVALPNIEREPFFGVGGVRWDAPRVRKLLRDVLPNGAQIEDFELDQEFPEIGRRHLLLNARQIDTTQTILIALEDVTERRYLEQAMQSHAQEVQALAASILTVQEEERRRVSRELHDQICQQLASLAFEIGGLVADLPPAEDTKQRLKALQARAVKASEETRHIAYELHPLVLDDLGLVASLKALCNEFSNKLRTLRSNSRTASCPALSPANSPRVCTASRKRVWRM